MPSRRQIREAVVQFLYCSDLEGGADPATVRESFWSFVTESDRRALLLATWKTINHLNTGRESRHATFLERLPTAQATLKAAPDYEALSNALEKIASLEDDWSGQVLQISKITKNENDHLAPRLENALSRLFAIDHDLSRLRDQFLKLQQDFPRLLPALEPINGSIARLERISERMRMIEEPEQFPDQSELAKIRESRASLESLRKDADSLADGVLSQKEEIDERLASVIENFAPERIDPVDRAILRLGSYEILGDESVPAPVAINEAINLAKRFGTSDSGRFVNGILDRIAKEAAASGETA